MTRPKAVPIRDLRDHLSTHLSRVRRGARIVVTDHGRPVAVLAPLPDGETTSVRLARAADAGEIEWSGEALPPYRPTARVRGPSVAAAVVEDRR